MCNLAKGVTITGRMLTDNVAVHIDQDFLGTQLTRALQATARLDIGYIYYVYTYCRIYSIISIDFNIYIYIYPLYCM